MRELSDPLLAAQAQPDPYALVQIRCKRRATFAGDPLAWRPLFRHTAENMPYGDAGVTAAVCACAETGAVVRVLRSQAAMKVGVQRFNVLDWNGSGSSWPSAAAAALTATPVFSTTLTAAVSGESTPAVGRAANTIRLFYANGGNLGSARSYNDGVSWGGVATLWNSAGAYTRLNHLAAIEVSYVVFNAYDSAGGNHIRGAQSVTAWTAWPELPNPGDWQVAGAVRGGPFEPEPCLYVYLWGPSGGYSCLACQRVKLNADGSFHSWDGTPQIVDRAGATGVNAYARVRFGPAAGSYLFALQEESVNRYWFVSSLFALPGSLDIEEPVYLGAAGSSPATAEYLQPLQAGRRAWLFGAGEVHASAQSDDAANLSVRSYTPTAYTYDAGASGGGQLSLTLERTLSADDPPEEFRAAATPEIYVGDILWLDRTLQDGAGQGGTMTLAFRVVQVTYSRRAIEILAADALAVLAYMRARRPKLLAAGERTRMGDVDALIHWAGLEAQGSATLPLAVYPSAGFQWPSNDNGLGALRRYLTDQTVALRPAGADSGGQSHTTVEVLPLPVESAYTYVTPDGWNEGFGSHEVSDWGLLLDNRQPRILVARGLASSADPEGALAHVIAPARALPGSRPVPLVLADYSYTADDGSLEARAAAEAQRLVVDLPLGWIEAGANLGIELYDVVTVDETDARVVRIVETWAQGRLRQRLELAEVNTFGVSVG